MLRKTFFTLFRVINLNYLFQKNNFNKLYILMIHQVNNDNSSFYRAVPNETFEQICKFCLKNFNVIYVREIEDYFKKPRKKPAVIISFDDGHYDILENAFPALNKYKLKFNVNIVTESMETGLPQDSVKVYDVLKTTEKEEYVNTDIFAEPVRIKIDKRNPAKTEKEFIRLFKNLNKNQKRLISNDVADKLSNASTKFSKMLSGKDVLYLHKNGAEIGSHTHSHAILTNIEMREVESELTYSKKLLEDLCGETIDILAFPQGRYDAVIANKAFDLGYRYLLLADDSENIFDSGAYSGVYHRTGLYYKTLNENLAKIFGFHKAIH